MENLNQETLLFENSLKSFSENSDKKFLVIGCGNGKWVKWLNEHGYETIGVDQDFDKIREAIRLYPDLEFFQHDFENIFYVNFFYGVYITDPSKVFHGTPSQKTYILKNTLSCLEKNGKLILFFQNVESHAICKNWLEKELDTEMDFALDNRLQGENQVDTNVLEITKHS